MSRGNEAAVVSHLVNNYIKADQETRRRLEGINANSLSYLYAERARLDREGKANRRAIEMRESWAREVARYREARR